MIVPEDENEHSGSIKCRNFHDYLRDYSLLTDSLYY
jgi:hypothetical protein